MIIDELSNFNSQLENLSCLNSEAKRFCKWLKETPCPTINENKKPVKIYLEQELLTILSKEFVEFKNYQFHAFGSRVWGDHNEDSDLDIIYEMSPEDEHDQVDRSALDTRLTEQTKIKMSLFCKNVLPIKIFSIIEKDLISF